MDKTTQNTLETVSISKEEFTQMKETIASLQGLGELVKTQAGTIKSLEEELATTKARIDNTTAAISGKYVRPAKIASGKHPYLVFKAKVMYKQANLDGTVAEKEVALDIDMPKPCGRLNSVMSELQNRVIPRLLQKKGITDYLIIDVRFDEKDVKKEMRSVPFVGKKVSDMTEDECQQFAIIYEGLQVPVTGSLLTLRQRVAQECAYVLHDTAYTNQLIIDGRVADKMSQTVDLVDYVGVRQDYPNLDAITPSKFRELAESAKEEADK